MGENSFGGQLNKNLDGSEDLIARVKASNSNAGKVKLIFDYVRHNMSWNDITSKVFTGWY